MKLPRPKGARTALPALAAILLAACFAPPALAQPSDCSKWIDPAVRQECRNGWRPESRPRPPAPPPSERTGRPAAAPARPARAELSPADLLASVRPSIWIVRARLPTGGVSNGSAVAVSPSHLLTACHLLPGVNEAEIVQGTVRRAVSVLVRNQPADRCVLVLPEASLTPLAGIRPFANIVVGERAFTVGAPYGRELTLGEGAVSALHPNNGFPLIQTTAPISPGSSGGALVDARGNLLGIVSFRVREDASMGFALAAESFWAPRQ